MKPISYTRSAIKALNRMPSNWSNRIRVKIEHYAEDPASLDNNVTELKGRSGVRLRVGDWRIIMEDGEVLAVFEIAPRGSVYD